MSPDTPMFEQTLSWPFFEDKHRRLAEMAARIDTQMGALIDAEHHDEDVYTLSPRFVEALAQGGWLEHAVALDDQIDVRSICLIRDMLARRSGLAEFCFALQGLGSAPISLFGTEDQRAKWLPEIRSGRRIAAFALSEPKAGSNPAEMQTEARRDGENWVLNGDKTWISNAGLAHQYIVFVRTAAGQGNRGLSCFVVEASNPGLSVSEKIDILAPHPLGSLAFKDCVVSSDAMLGTEGEGFKIAMTVLDAFRSSVGASAVGMARRALDHTRQRVAQRTIGGHALASYQMTQDKLADMATLLEASALLVYRAAWVKDVQKRRTSREAAMAKMFASENAQIIIDKGLQLFGGMGVVVGMPMERLYREIRSLRIYEGTTEIQKLIIAGQIMGRD